MKAKYTPTKWQFEQYKEGASNLFRVLAPGSTPNQKGKRMIICKVPFEVQNPDFAQVHALVEPTKMKNKIVRRTKEEAEANAKLIAAAPQLLAALELAWSLLIKDEVQETGVIQRAWNNSLMGRISGTIKNATE